MGPSSGSMWNPVELSRKYPMLDQNAVCFPRSQDDEIEIAAGCVSL